MAISVLIADDHEANRSILRRRLERRGFAVREARDGQEAIDAARAQRPDVVLMDLTMPGVDGFDAWRAIRQLPHPPAAIALTATVLPQVRQQCLDLGFSAFVEKPIDFDAMVAVIERCSSHRAVAR